MMPREKTEKLLNALPENRLSMSIDGFDGSAKDWVKPPIGTPGTGTKDPSL
jgi:hypothetical protein